MSGLALSRQKIHSQIDARSTSRMNAGFELSSLDCGNIWQLEDKSTHGWWLFQMKRLSRAKCPARATPPRTKKAATCRPRLASPHTTTKVSAFPTQRLPDRLVLFLSNTVFTRQTCRQFLSNSVLQTDLYKQKKPGIVSGYFAWEDF